MTNATVVFLEARGIYFRVFYFLQFSIRNANARKEEKYEKKRKPLKFYVIISTGKTQEFTVEEIPLVQLYTVQWLKTDRIKSEQYPRLLDI